jgi:hypothetical protein
MIGLPRTVKVERALVGAWMPDYRDFGYSRHEAEQIARIAERLWIRYTVRGLTIECPNPMPTALDRFDVLVQAVCHFGLRNAHLDP